MFDPVWSCVRVVSVAPPGGFAAGWQWRWLLPSCVVASSSQLKATWRIDELSFLFPREHTDAVWVGNMAASYRHSEMFVFDISTKCAEDVAATVHQYTGLFSESTSGLDFMRWASSKWYSGSTAFSLNRKLLKVHAKDWRQIESIPPRGKHPSPKLSDKMSDFSFKRNTFLTNPILAEP